MKPEYEPLDEIRKCKTIQGIVDFLRERAAYFAQNMDYYEVADEVFSDELSAIADSIEAAENSKKKAIGNAAAMREALEWMCKASQDVFRSFARETFAGERRLDSLGVAFDKAQAALSVPARNCDMCRDVDEAYNQFMLYVKRENPAFIKSSPLHTVWDALKWVLDGTAEREGE